MSQEVQYNVKKRKVFQVSCHRGCFAALFNESIRNLRQNLKMFCFICCVACGIGWKVKHRQGWWQLLYVSRLGKLTLVSCKS